MHTESLLVRYSVKRVFETVGHDPVSIINGFKKNLPKALWNISDSYKAKGDINFPFGLPVIDGGTKTPKDKVNCGAAPFVTLGNTGVRMYDPGRQDPPLSTPTCAWAPIATTATGTLANIIGVATFYQPFTGSYVLVGLTYVLTFTASTAGPEFNFVNLAVEARWGSAGIIQGGGYQFEAVEAESPYKVSITALSGFNNYRVYFDFIINGHPAQYFLDTGVPLQPTPPISSYTIYANPHGFFISDGTSIVGAFNRNTSLFVAAPHLTCGALYSVFILSPGGQIRTHTFYNGVVTTCIDTTAATFSDSGGFPKLLTLRSAGLVPLITPNNKPILTTAYISYGTGPSNSQIGAIIGILFDCVVCSDQVLTLDPSGFSGLMASGVKYIAVGSQDGGGGGTRSTLLMAIPDNVDHSVTGVANVFGSGVTRVSGGVFTQAMVGRIFTVTDLSNGIVYSEVILSVQDGDNLTLKGPVQMAGVPGNYSIA